MTILFAGGEDADFTSLGSVAVDTATTAARRTSNARCSLKVNSSGAGDGWQALLSAPSASFWFTARSYVVDGAAGYPAVAHAIVLVDALGVRRLVLTCNGPPYSTLGLFNWRLIKLDASGAATTLVTTTSTISCNALVKFDMFVNYAVTGQVQLYLGGTKVIDYSGDVTTNSVSTLAGVILGQPIASSSFPMYWSEVIAATTDTRSLSLATLPPAAAGNAFTWTGAATDVNEITLDDATQITSLTAGQLAETTVTSASIVGTPGIVAVVVNARAQKGSTGPQNADLLVRTGGTDYASPDIALPASLGRISNVWVSNPATGNAWLASDLTQAGFNVGIKSVA